MRKLTKLTFSKILTFKIEFRERLRFESKVKHAVVLSMLLKLVGTSSADAGVVNWMPITNYDLPQVNL
jgi:hypothetical protein